MSYYRSTPPRGGWGGGEVLGLPPVTPVNRALLAACIAVWVVQFVAWIFARIDLAPWLGLVPALVVRGFVWQPATYIFLHDPLRISHVLFNLLFVWVLGGDLERHWGGRKYLTYWFVCGVGAGLCVTAASAWRGPDAALVPTIGASGAIFGLILAYGTIFAERRLLWNFLFPIKARTMAWIMFAIEVYSLFVQPGDGVSHLAHLGGAAIGWLYLKRAWRIGEFWSELRWAVKRRRFKVMPPDDRDRWIH